MKVAGRIGLDRAIAGATRDIAAAKWRRADW